LSSHREVKKGKTSLVDRLDSGYGKKSSLVLTLGEKNRRAKGAVWECYLQARERDLGSSGMGIPDYFS